MCSELNKQHPTVKPKQSQNNTTEFLSHRMQEGLFKMAEDWPQNLSTALEAGPRIPTATRPPERLMT